MTDPHVPMLDSLSPAKALAMASPADVRRVLSAGPSSPHVIADALDCDVGAVDLALGWMLGHGMVRERCGRWEVAP